MEVPRLLNTPKYSTLFGSAPLRAQVRLLLGSFRSAWGMSFVFFAIHLVLVGYLVYKSGYIPKPVGILLMIAALGYLIQNLGPYLFPQADLGLVSISLLES